MEHQIKHFKSNAYYKESNDQRSINDCQEKVDILEDMMQAEREDGRKKMYYMQDELAETQNKSYETVAETRYDAHRQIAEMKDKVYEFFDKAEDMRRAICRNTANTLPNEKEKVPQVRQISSKETAEKREEMEENSAEVR